jgi:hypothetical protein
MRDSARYQIQVKETLSDFWSDWFDGLVIQNQPNGETVLSGMVRDQANLHGILTKIRDLGLTLVSLERVEPNQNEEES